MRNSCPRPKLKLIRQNLRIVKRLYPDVTELQLSTLHEISASLQLSISSGDLMLLDGRWYVTHSGLLRTAKRMRCSGINTELEGNVSNPTLGRWVFKATVCQSGKRFVGYGDADPSNVSPLVHGAEMRVAETRAVNRALRKAYGIGICSIEEIGSLVATMQSQRQAHKLPPQPANGNYGGPKVRHRVCPGWVVPRPGRSRAVSLAHTETVLPDPLRCSRAEASRRMSDHRPPLLHGQSDVEAELVSARLRLRHRAAGKR